MELDKIIYPWDYKRGENKQQDLVIKTLSEMGFRTRFSKNYIDPRIVEILFDTFAPPNDNELFFDYDRPWILLLSNSDNILGRVEEVIPVIFALTTNLFPAVLTTADLADIYLSPPPKTLWEADPIGNKLDQLTAARLVVYKRFNTKHKWASNHAGKLSVWLTGRHVETRLVLSTALYKGKRATEKIIDRVFAGAEDALGEDPALTIQEYSSIVDLPITHTPASIRRAPVSD